MDSAQISDWPEHDERGNLTIENVMDDLPLHEDSWAEWNLHW